MTVEWFKFLNSLKEEIKRDWANSLYVGASADETIQRNASAIGQVDLLSRLGEAKVEDVQETNADNRE
ncbi:MAG: hypothetical protein DDT42_01936 [candidate division WS2 bacterium]|uniref:Uncharacterized protein n=1 Tax=Psychracetigena formicireducens TaxID=2986056 RepID=A0A9E2BIA7_PSYF1|nr:hypothetical protein [Candidatus Psychracetigena formicireducens]